MIPIDLSRFQLKFGTVESLLALEIVEIEIEAHIDCFWVTLFGSDLLKQFECDDINQSTQQRVVTELYRFAV